MFAKADDRRQADDLVGYTQLAQFALSVLSRHAKAEDF